MRRGCFLFCRLLEFYQGKKYVFPMSSFRDYVKSVWENLCVFVCKAVFFYYILFWYAQGNWMINGTVSSWAWPHILPQIETLEVAQLGSKGVMKSWYRWHVNRAALSHGIWAAVCLEPLWGFQMIKPTFIETVGGKCVICPPFTKHCNQYYYR